MSFSVKESLELVLANCDGLDDEEEISQPLELQHDSVGQEHEHVASFIKDLLAPDVFSKLHQHINSYFSLVGLRLRATTSN